MFSDCNCFVMLCAILDLHNEKTYSFTCFFKTYSFTCKKEILVFRVSVICDLCVWHYLTFVCYLVFVVTQL